MGAFEYRQAEEIRDAMAAFGVRYLFLGKSGAILLGFPDTTQDVDVFVAKSEENCRALTRALARLGFELTAEEIEQLLHGKDVVQLKNGPFDLDLTLRRMGSNDSMMHGNGALKLKAFPCATWTTSSPANRRQGASRTVNRCPG